MNFKKRYLLVPALLSLASVASAQNFTGVLGIQEDTSQTGSYSASSIMLDASNFTEPGSATGTFASTVPAGTIVTAYSSDLTGLSSTPENISISDFLQIGTPGYFGSSGTTPNNRFDFNLQTLAEPSSGDFIGTGTLTDTATTGAYSPTPAEILLSFSNANNYSFTLQVVPEPATLSLLLGGLGVLPLIRRKG